MHPRHLAAVVLVLGLNLPAMVLAGNLHGVRVEPPRPIQPVQLIDQEARPRQFPMTRQGWQLVIFGYTHCPDVCPMTLHKAAQLREVLGSDRDRVQIVFVSIDSNRDTAATMKEFVEKFDARIVGLTGEPESLQAAANAFEVMTRRFQGKTALAYTLVHSSLMYMLDPEGRVRVIYPGSASIENIAADLRSFW